MGSSMADKRTGSTRRSFLTGTLAGTAILSGCAARVGSTSSYLTAFAPRSADPVFEWTDIALQAIRDQIVAPPLAARALAMGHVAGFCAVNGVEERYSTYRGLSPAESRVDARSAYGTAFRVAIAEHFQQPFALEHARFLSTIPDSDAKSRGVEWGARIGRAIVKMRTGDGTHPSRSDHYLGRYTRRDDVLRWRPTGPHFDAGEGPAYGSYQRGLLPGFGQVRPWGVSSLASFRAPAFPHPRSAEFARQYDMVRRLGRSDSVERTRDQREIALFWEDGPWGVTPPGHFAVVAMQLMARNRMTFTQRARGMALVSMAMADAATTTWDSKYAHDVLRPETAIRYRAAKLDPRLAGDSNWKSLIPTPPFPAYTSGHSAFGAAGTRMLAHVLGTDRIRLAAKSPDRVIWPKALADAERSWTSLSQMAEENGMSRIYGGVHWLADHVEGMRAGRDVADAIHGLNFRAASA